MNRSTTSLVFPDVNVWLAMSSPDHTHFAKAWSWYTALPAEAVPVFCRFTQLGLLRLLTTQSVMGAGTLTQAEAWNAYDEWIKAAGAEFASEPAGIDSCFRSKTDADTTSPKAWADAYLAAFAEAGGLRIVTFDRALAGKAKGAVLLG